MVVGVFLGNPDILANSGGYTGFGGIAGYIQIVISPTEDDFQNNLQYLKVNVAHEFHHNVLFYNAKWNFLNEVSVARYITVEGLAESFTASLYGEEYLGPWVTNVKGQELEKSREIIGKFLNIKGFYKVLQYIFGGHMMNLDSSKPQETPAFAGRLCRRISCSAGFLKKDRYNSRKSNTY